LDNNIFKNILVTFDIYEYLFELNCDSDPKISGQQDTDLCKYAQIQSTASNFCIMILKLLLKRSFGAKIGQTQPNHQGFFGLVFVLTYMDPAIIIQY